MSKCPPGALYTGKRSRTAIRQLHPVGIDDEVWNYVRKPIRSPFGLAFVSGVAGGRVMAQRVGIDETNP